LISNVFFIIFAANKIIHDMDLMGNVNNASYGVAINGRDDIKIISFYINLSEVSDDYGNVVIRVDSVSKDDKLDTIEKIVIDDLMIFNWIERENKILLLLNCIAMFYFRNTSKINISDLLDLLHFAFNRFFDWDMTQFSFSEDLINFRKFTILSIPCTELQLSLYDEMITYFSERGL
jgi:hypothetical protein